jgi:hypothetical protein
MLLLLLLLLLFVSRSLRYVLCLAPLLAQAGLAFAKSIQQS